MEVSLVAEGRGNAITEEDVRSDSNMDADELRMIDEGLTQLEVRLEVGSRTIEFPMNRNLLVNTKEIVFSFGPLCSEIEGMTIKTINDSTLSNNIVCLALRVSIFVVHSFPYVLFSFVGSRSYCSFCKRSFWRSRMLIRSRNVTIFM